MAIDKLYSFSLFCSKQIGLIALWKGSQRYDPQKGEFASYIYKYIRGTLLTALSKDKKRDDVCFSTDESTLLDTKFKDRLFEIEDLLSHFYHLTDLQKNWVVKRFYYGLSNRDIAEMEKVPLRKVRAWGECWDESS